MVDGGERGTRQERKNGAYNRTPYVATRVGDTGA